MKCPECGFEQKPREVCSICGLVLSDYLAKKAMERDRPEPTEEQIKRGQMVSIKRGHKIIRNVNTRDLPEKIQSGEVYSSDEISQDEKKWIVAGKHPQLKSLFEKADDPVEDEGEEEIPKEPSVVVRDPLKKTKLERLEKRHKAGKISEEEYTQERNKILQKAMDEQRVHAGKTEKRATLSGGLGVLMLSIGVYLPIYKVRLVPNTNLYDKSLIELGVIAFLTVFAMIDMARNDFRWARSIGFVIAVALGAIFYMQHKEISDVISYIKPEMSGGVFDGYNRTGAEKIKPAYGWIVLGLGAFMVHLSGWFRDRTK